MPRNARSRGEHLAIGVLGPLEVTRAGASRPLPRSRKTRGLLAYLALSPRACRRGDLCDLFWEDGVADPRGELRWSLAKLRAAVGPWLLASSDGVSLEREGLCVDADAFRDMAVAAPSESGIARALALWRGPALADADVQGRHAFQAWLAAERESLSALRRKLAEAAVDRAWADPESALSAARRLVAQEPWAERGHARVAQSLERCGRLAEASAYAAAARRSLARELGVPEDQVLLEAPPPPATGSVAGGRPPTPRRAPRSVLWLEPLRLVPDEDDGLVALATLAAADLGSGLWRNRCCDLLDEGRRAGSRADGGSEADFALRGVLVRSGDGVRLSLRCVDLRLGTVAWSGQAEPARPFARSLSRWIEGAVDAIGACIRAAGPAAGAGSLWSRILAARSLAGALQPGANGQALDLLGDVLAEDGDEPAALALAAWCHAQRAVYNWSADAGRDRGEARRCAALATRDGLEDAECLTAIAAARTLVADRNGAEALLDRALRLDPRSAGAHVRSGWLANYLDQPARAARHFRTALGLAPLDPASFNCRAGIGVAHYIRGEHGLAIRHMEQALALNPKAVWIYRNLVAAYAAVGDRRKAEDGVGALVQDHPGLTVAAVCDAMVFSPTVMARIAGGLGWAGLPQA